MRICFLIGAWTLVGCTHHSDTTPRDLLGVADLAVADLAVRDDADPVIHMDMGLDLGPADAGYQTPDAAIIPDGGCEVYGAPGSCEVTTDCTGDHTAYAGHCPGAADIQCCIVTPSTANNPPEPKGWVLMQQVNVTSAMTDWAITILNDPTHYPMFSTTIRQFPKLEVLARVEWHPPDFQNGIVHRGVTLYQPAP